MTKLAWVALIACLLQTTVVGGAEAQSSTTNPLDPDRVIDDLVPQPGSIFEIGVPESWFDRKDRIYDKIGLKFGFSYQVLGQRASDVLPDASYKSAVGDWWGFLAKWTMLNRGGNKQGTFVFSMFDRGAVGNNAVPSNFGIVDVGSITTNVEFTTWSLAIENLYWEQSLSSDHHELMFRVGNQVVTTLLNPFRFKDSRVSYTTGPWAFHPSVPYPTFGFGAAFKWRPDRQAGLYLSGSLNDMNGDPNLQGFDWSTVERGEFFYGLEIGYDRKRARDDYDHVHLLVFYADERSTRFPDTLPNKAGGGFRLSGEKQWDRWVGLAGYTFNTAEGGGVTGTFSKNVLSVGAAYLNPVGVRGEVSASLLYMDPIDEIFGGAVRDEFGLEAYWRMSLTENIWITPGARLIVNPALNPEVDFVAIPHLKLRVAI